MSQMWIRKYGNIGPNVYDGHNADVRRLIPIDQLLVYDVREGWEPLCNFLEVPVPNEPFPNLNDSQAMRAIYIGQMAFGLFHWVVYATGATSLAYLAMYPEFTKRLAQAVMDQGTNILSRVGLK